jgi:predicted metal-dependent phosphoesterase TrpH
MKFELHCHSSYSHGKKITCEGLNSPAELIKAAKRKGLAGLAITDHNNSESWTEAARAAKSEGIIFIPGIEVSTSRGHLIGLGLNEHIDLGMTVSETIDRIHAQGGIAIAPHPFDIKGEGIKHECAKTDAVEVFNSMNLDKLANMFTERWARNRGMAVTCGSDAHNIDMMGCAINNIDAQDVDSVIAEIRKGRVVVEKNYIPVSVLSAWAKARMERSYQDILRYIGENYWEPKAWVARGLLNKFVFSERMKIWKVVGYTSVGISRVYGGLKILSYY